MQVQKHEDVVWSLEEFRCGLTQNQQLQLCFVLSLQIIGNNNFTEVHPAVPPPQLPDTEVSLCTGAQSTLGLMCFPLKSGE